MAIDDSTEVWLPVVGYEGMYSVSSHGRVMRSGNAKQNTRIGLILRQKISRIGYHSVGLYGPDQKRRDLLVHRMVLVAFLGDPPLRHESRHLNGDSSDNRLSNLAWSTHIENIADKTRHGTIARGSRVGSSKLNEELVSSLRSLRAQGTSVRELALKFGIARITVRRIVSRMLWKHVH